MTRARPSRSPDLRASSAGRRLSGAFTAGLAGLLVLLAFAPYMFGENALNNLIQLYFLVILA